MTHDPTEHPELTRLRARLRELLDANGGDWTPSEYGAHIGDWRVRASLEQGSLAQKATVAIGRVYAYAGSIYAVRLNVRDLDALLCELAPQTSGDLDAVPFPMTASGSLVWLLAATLGGALAWALVGASALLAVL